MSAATSYASIRTVAQRLLTMAQAYVQSAPAALDPLALQPVSKDDAQILEVFTFCDLDL